MENTTNDQLINTQLQGDNEAIEEISTNIQNEELDSSNDEESNFDKLKKLSELLPLLGIILLFIGFMRHYFFYQNFGVDISEYIETIEILQFFLPDVIDILFVIIFIIFYSQVISALIDKIWIWIKGDNESVKDKTIGDLIEEGKGAYNELKPTIKHSVNFGTVIANVLFFVISFYFYQEYKNRFVALWNISLFLQGLDMLFIFILKDASKNRVQLIQVLCCSVYFTWILADYDTSKLKKEINNISYEIQTKDKLVIKTDRQYYKIGVTSKYLFLFCEFDKKVEVLKREDIEKINIVKTQ